MDIPRLRHVSTATVAAANQRPGSNPLLGATTAPAGEPYLTGSLREATEEFESLFVSQVVKAMRQSVPESGLVGLNGGQRLFRELLDGELARHIAHSGGFGIGEALYQHLAPEVASADRPDESSD